MPQRHSPAIPASLFASGRSLKIALGLVALVLALAACSIGGGSTGGATGGSTGGASTGPTATPAGPTCSTHATATAIVWDDGQQVQGSINGGAAAALSNFSYPLGLPDEGNPNPPTLGYIAVAPDGHHLAVSVDILVPFSEISYPYIVDTTTHAVTKAALPHYPSSPDQEGRPFAWADNHTLVVFPGRGGSGGGLAASQSYSYDITTATATALPSFVTSAVEGEVRCGSLYWLELTPLSTSGTSGGFQYFRGQANLHRFNLATSTAIGGPIAIGDTNSNGGAEGQVDWPGWDVSRDGTHLVYQQMTVTFNGTENHVSSAFKLASSDGSGAAAILTGANPATSTSGTGLSFSADGTQVAVTNAQSTPTVASGPTAGGTPRYYSPDAAGLPAWLPDNSGFLAATQDDTPAVDIYQYLLATPLAGNGRAPGTEVHATGSDPATLP